MYYPPGPRVRSRGGETASITQSDTNGYTKVWHQQLTPIETIQDIVVPNAKKILASGGIINNPMTVSVILDTDTPGSYSVVANWGTYTAVNSDITLFFINNTENLSKSFYPRVIPPEIQDQLLSIAKQRALQHIDPTDFQFGEDAFEAKKTYEMLKDPLGVMRDTHTKLRGAMLGILADHSGKNAGKMSVKALSAFSSAYLGTKFAYGSFLYTASNIYAKQKYFDKINRCAKVSNRLRRAKGQASRHGTYHDIITGDRSTQHVTFAQNQTWSVSVRAGIMYNLAPATRNNMIGQDWGLRLKDIPRAAWAVQPMTWYTDRFFNIGSAITGAMNLLDPRVTVASAYFIIEMDINDNIVVSSITEPGTTVTISGSNVYENHTLSRTPWIPTFSDTRPTPDFRAIRDVANQLDGIAVAANALNGLLNTRYKLHFPKETFR